MGSVEITPCYPAALLTATVAARVEYFEVEAMVQHPSQTELLTELNVLTSCPTDRNLILVVGPTGVGKSALLRLLNKKINGSLTAEQVTSRQIGSVLIKLVAPKTGAYNFSALHREALIQMGSPLVDRTRPIVYREVDGVKIPTLMVERDLNSLRGSGLERRFYEVVNERKPRALLLDEGGAIFVIGRFKSVTDRLQRLSQQAQWVKDLANTAESTVVICGAYDFFDLSISSGQNARRTIIVHVRPYLATEEGLMGFAVAIIALLRHLPVQHELVPAVVASELFLQGLGCVGTAAGILCQGMRRAVVTGSVLTMEMLRKCYYPRQALETMRSEMAEGMGRVDALLTLAELLPTNVPDPDAKNVAPSTSASPAIKPGETKPSHMAESKGLW